MTTGKALVFFLSAALAAFPIQASTCIVEPASGDPDPHHSLSSSVVAVDAAAGTSAIVDSLLEARFQSICTSDGIALTTKPLGTLFSIR